MDNSGEYFPDNQYLKPGTYSVYVKDKDGNTTETTTEYVYQHSLLLTGTAYPGYIRGKSTYNNITHVTVSVGFQQYEGVIDSEGNIVVEFPKQKVGAVINILCQDDDERLCVQINKVSVWIESKYVISVSPSSQELKKRIR